MGQAAATGLALRVVSYNVHTQRDDVSAMTTLVRSLRPDVMIVQEAPRRFRWRSRCAQLARRFGLLYACGGLPSLGNLVLTNLRVSVHDTWCVQYPLTPGRHLRGAALARCSVAGHHFAVAGTHLSTDPRERPVQAAALAQLLSEVDVPLVLGADLNETSGSAAWRMIASGLTDVAVVAGQSTTPTYPTAAPRQRLDVIFADPRFGVRAYQVVDGALAQSASDHFPVLADLVLPDAGQNTALPPRMPSGPE
jgi:endonuclease/exonuclease/phosphatase family metal-dependent hydrolase